MNVEVEKICVDCENYARLEAASRREVLVFDARLPDDQGRGASPSASHSQSSGTPLSVTPNAPRRDKAAPIFFE